MKKIILFAGVLLISLANLAEVKAQQNAIKINPLSIFVLTGNVSYERVLSPATSLQLGVYYGGINLGFGSGGDVSGGIKYNWVGVTPEFRYYVTKNKFDAPKGFYVGPYLRWQDWTAGYTVEDNDQFGNPYQASVKVGIMQIGGGAKLGYQFLFGDVVTMDLFLGLGYNAANVRVKENNSSSPDDQINYTGLGGSGVGFPAGMTIGFAF